MRYVSGLQPDSLNACAIDIHVQRGPVECLLHVDVDGTGNVAHLVCQLLCEREIGLLIVAGDGHVDGRGRAEIQDLGDDVRGLKEKLYPREPLRKFLAQRGDVSARGLAAHFLQLHKYLAVGRAKSSGIAVAEIQAAVRHAEVVEDRLQLVAWNSFPD